MSAHLARDLGVLSAPIARAFGRFASWYGGPASSHRALLTCQVDPRLDAIANRAILAPSATGSQQRAREDLVGHFRGARLALSRSISRGLVPPDAPTLGPSLPPAGWLPPPPAPPPSSPQPPAPRPIPSQRSVAPWVRAPARNTVVAWVVILGFAGSMVMREGDRRPSTFWVAMRPLLRYLGLVSARPRLTARLWRRLRRLCTPYRPWAVRAGLLAPPPVPATVRLLRRVPADVRRFLQRLRGLSLSSSSSQVAPF